jgi:hypothetical protein
MKRSIFSTSAIRETYTVRPEVVGPSGILSRSEIVEKAAGAQSEHPVYALGGMGHV